MCRIIRLFLRALAHSQPKPQAKSRRTAPISACSVPEGEISISGKTVWCPRSDSNFFAALTTSLQGPGVLVVKAVQ
jgi:hypothetical protein